MKNNAVIQIIIGVLGGIFLIAMLFALLPPSRDPDSINTTVVSPNNPLPTAQVQSNFVPFTTTNKAALPILPFVGDSNLSSKTPDEQQVPIPVTNTINVDFSGIYTVTQK